MPLESKAPQLVAYVLLGIINCSFLVLLDAGWMVFPSRECGPVDRPCRYPRFEAQIAHQCRRRRDNCTKPSEEIPNAGIQWAREQSEFWQGL